MASRRNFLKSLVAVSAAPLLPELPAHFVEAVAEKASELPITVGMILPRLCNPPYGTTFSQMVNAMWDNPSLKQYGNYPEMVVEHDRMRRDLQEWARWKGVNFDDLCSRISTASRMVTNSPIHQYGLRNMFGRLNLHNESDLEMLFSEQWDQAIHDLHRLGYNVHPRGKWSTGCPASWFDQDDHLPVPRDIEYYKQVRREAFERVYEDELSKSAQRVIDSEVFFDDEEAVNRSSDPHEEWEWDEELGEDRVVIRSTALVPSHISTKCVLEVVPTYGPEFSFMLLRPRFKFGA